jgi:DNA-binding protein H-NS
MSRSTLEAMSLDDLWNLHKRVVSILEERLDREKQKLEQQLEELGRKFGGPPSDIPQRRPYPKVPQKYCNPEYPAQTWSGRGKQPRWVKKLIASGASLEDLSISSAELVRAWLKRASR